MPQVLTWETFAVGCVEAGLPFVSLPVCYCLNGSEMLGSKLKGLDASSQAKHKAQCLIADFQQICPENRTYTFIGDSSCRMHMGRQLHTVSINISLASELRSCIVPLERLCFVVFVAICNAS